MAFVGQDEGPILGGSDPEIEKNPKLLSFGGAKSINLLYHDSINSIVYSTPHELQQCANRLSFTGLLFGNTSTVNIPNEILTNGYIHFRIALLKLLDVFLNKGWGFEAIQDAKLKISGMNTEFSFAGLDLFVKTYLQSESAEKLNAIMNQAGEILLENTNILGSGVTLGAYAEAYVPLSALFFSTVNSAQALPADFSVIGKGVSTLTLVLAPKRNYMSGYGVSNNSTLTGFDSIEFVSSEVNITNPLYKVMSHPQNDPSSVQMDYPFGYIKSYPVGANFTGSVTETSPCQIVISNFEDANLAYIVLLLRQTEYATSTSNNNNSVGLLYEPAYFLRIYDGNNVLVDYSMLHQKTLEANYKTGGIGYEVALLQATGTNPTQPFAVLPKHCFINAWNVSLLPQELHTQAKFNSTNFWKKVLTLKFNTATTNTYEANIFLIYNSAIHVEDGRVSIV